jgi:hypothetical protein
MKTVWDIARMFGIAVGFLACLPIMALFVLFDILKGRDLCQ